jgi:NADPH:quinone reductase-like Zn-dependent oxidoreductase
MRAYEIRSPEGIDALVSAERDVPEPGTRQVRVRVRASAVNYRDLATIEDPAPRGIRYPTVPNSDAAGEVVALGRDVRSLALGDRVASCFFQRWTDGAITPDAMASALGGALDGVLAEEVVLDEQGVVPIPAHLDFTAAATLPCAALTAWHAVVEFGALRPGETVLLLGTGGVSIFALQFAKLLGARVVLVSGSDAKIEHARALGADACVNYRTNPDWNEHVLALSDGAGVDLAVEVGGAGTLERSIASTRVAGRIALIGVLTGGEMNPVMIMRKSIRVQGIYVGSRAMFERMNQAISQHRLEPVVHERFTFDNARAAYHAMRAAGHFGKLVIDLSGDDR